MVDRRGFPTGRQADGRSDLLDLVSDVAHPARSPEEKGSETCAILFWNRCVGTVWG
jgi:hypothetical protein